MNGFIRIHELVIHIQSYKRLKNSYENKIFFKNKLVQNIIWIVFQQYIIKFQQKLI